MEVNQKWQPSKLKARNKTFHNINEKIIIKQGHIQGDFYLYCFYQLYDYEKGKNSGKGKP